jgi:Nucleotidyltransferase of unknown function (DUF6036)
MRRFSPVELEKYFEAVDGRLEAEAGALVIGGAAAALAYGVGQVTRDVDLFHAPSPALAAALARARQDTGLDIHAGAAPRAEFPRGFEGRLRPVLWWLRRLRLRVPDPVDLALGKFRRAAESDLQVVEAIAAAQPLDFDVLLARYLFEDAAAPARTASADLGFLAGIGRLHPDRLAEAERALAKRGRS